MTQLTPSRFLSARKLAIPIAVLGLLAFLLFSLNHKTAAPAVTFTTIEGKNITLNALKGKVVLVNFWATDCPGCIAEMPALIQTYHDYHARGLEIVAVAMPYDPPSQVLNYVKKNALPFLVMHDGLSEVSASFDEVNLTPTTFVIDKEGRVIRKVIGELDFKSLHSLLDKQLAGNA